MILKIYGELHLELTKSQIENTHMDYSFHCTKNEEILNGKLHFLCNV